MPDSSSAIVEEVLDVAAPAAAESSTAVNELDVKEQAAAPSSADDSTKASEGAKVEDVKPKSMLEAVTAAITPKTSEAPDAAASSTTEGGDKGSEAASTEAIKVEDDKLPFARHPRWREVLHERRAQKGQIEALTSEVEPFRQFQAAVRGAGLQAQEIDTGFDIMSLMKSNPVAAYEKLKPYMDTLEAFVGNRLPADLQAKVDSGTVDQETAQELARTRAHSGFVEARTQQTEEQRQRDEQTQAQAAAARFNDECATAVSVWERQLQVSDPDYASKKSRLVNAVYVEMLGQRDARGNFVNAVNSKEDAVNLAKKALEEVNNTFAPLTRKTTEKRSIGGGSSASQAVPRPKSLREAITQAAAGQYKSAALKST